MAAAAYGWRPAGLLIAALLGIASLDFAFAPDRALSRPDGGQRLLTGAPATNYQAALAEIEANVAAAVQRAEERPGEWLIHEAAARAHLDRARLTGSFSDYRSAQAALDRAFEVADPAAGPHLLQAILAFRLHRLDESERMLNRIDAYAVPPLGADRAELLGIRGDIAFYRGEYPQALQHYRHAAELADGAADFRLALYHAQMGNRNEAATYLDRLQSRLSSPTPRRAAEMALHKGILELDHGRTEGALAHFRRADALFPGHWLIEEHLAEALALRGELGEAERLYRSVVRRTGRPEYVDALAAIARRKGDSAAARRLTELAAERWSQRLRELPDAAYGHALDHCLEAQKPRCALQLARLNHAARPFGESQLKLAQALLLNGRTKDASEHLRLLKKSGWNPAQVDEAMAALPRAR